MDVSRNDPAAIFIRPPLVVPFPPNAESNNPVALNGTDGQPIPGTSLTYTILHAHRNWFLDADDFRKDNPNRIDYPPELEPPRGWAPLNECTGVGGHGRKALTPKLKQVLKLSSTDHQMIVMRRQSFAAHFVGVSIMGPMQNQCGGGMSMTNTKWL